MKLILSRKGFDSGSGGCPSPIFPDRTLYSLPIPDNRGKFNSKITYEDLWHDDINIGDVVEDLTCKRRPKNRIGSKCPAHLDPDINCSAYSPRKKGWRPLFGQTENAQGHLRNQGVRCGDLFLFFGLFRKVEKTSGKWSFVKNAPKPQHILWGWLQIGKIHKIDEPVKVKQVKTELPWARYHPHLSPCKGLKNNTLYIASDGLNLGDGPIAQGAGCFLKHHGPLVLTNPNGSGVTDWRLPQCFYPDNGKCPLTGHPRNLWKHKGEHSYVQRTGQGQEFVLDLDQYPGVTDWLMESIFTCT